MHFGFWTFWIVDSSLAIYVLSLVLARGFALPQQRARWGQDGLLIVVLIITLGGLRHLGAETIAALALIAGSLWFLVRSYRRSARLKAAWLLRWQNEAAAELTVELPFRGRWKALGCGPNPAKNHHMATLDQWFAVDWVREDGESLGSEIRSPVDGVVAYIEDGHPDLPPARWRRKSNLRSPAGNHVSIEVVRGSDESSIYLLLCHLKKGSIQVGVGHRVRTGELVGLCGNSGNTSVPHLHIHAQDQAKIAIGQARAVRLRFPGGDDPGWIRPGTVLAAA